MWGRFRLGLTLDHVVFYVTVSVSVSVDVCWCSEKGIESLEKGIPYHTVKLCNVSINYPSLFITCPSLPSSLLAMRPTVFILSLFLSVPVELRYPRHERDQIPFPEPRRSSV